MRRLRCAWPAWIPLSWSAGWDGPCLPGFSCRATASVAPTTSSKTESGLLALTERTTTEGAVSWKTRVLNELHPSVLFPNLIAGLVAGIVVVIVAIATATLIFHGELESQLARGIGLSLVSGILITIVLALKSSFSAMMGQAQDRVAPALAVIAASVTAQLSGQASSETVFITVVAAIGTTAVFSGVLLSLLGYFRLGNLIRFIPYPVIGGFLGGTGYLLVQGSFGVMTRIELSLSTIDQLMEASVLPLWLTGVLFGLVVVVATRTTSHYLLLPFLLVGGMITFHLTTALLGLSAGELETAGWLLGPFPEGGRWSLLTLEALGGADWGVVASQWGNMVTVFVITLVSVLLNAGALELMVRKDIDLNQELRAAGLANLLIGASCGPVGFQSLSMSRLVHRMGTRSRMVGIFAAVVCLLVLASGTSMLNVLPRAILGGLLFFLGMDFLIEWVFEAYGRLEKSEYVVVLIIMVAIATTGYIAGVLVGILACVMLFLVSYSRVSIVKLALDGTEIRSRVERSVAQNRFLEAYGEQVRVYKLHGYIFFGTARNLFHEVQNSSDDLGHRLKYLVFDFKWVTGIDSSCVLVFMKTCQIAERNGFTLVFIGVSPEHQRMLDREKFNELLPEVYLQFDNLDVGLEWCENQLLTDCSQEAEPFAKQLARSYAGLDISLYPDFFVKQHFDEGATLIHQGDQSDAMYLIDEGRVTARLTMPGGRVVRLRSWHQGTIVGEIGTILQQSRSATVVADCPLVVYRLEQSALERMALEEPELALAFQNYLNRLIAERLVRTSRSLHSALD